MYEARIIINALLWDKLIGELKLRGKGSRESGAFLLGPLDNNEVTHFILFDDLDPDCLDTGIIVFRGIGFVGLWQYCNAHSYKVFADVHTHPKGWTGLSEADIDHPMIHIAGHVGLIVPWFATRGQKDLTGVGVHEYLGNKQWKSWNDKSRIFQIIT